MGVNSLYLLLPKCYIQNRAALAEFLPNIDRVKVKKNLRKPID